MAGVEEGRERWRWERGLSSRLEVVRGGGYIGKCRGAEEEDVTG